MIKARHVKPRALFWFVAILALLWYLFGVLQCYNTWTMTADSLAPMVSDGRVTQDYVDYLLIMPAWVKVLFAVATGGGAVGALLLLLRRSSAILLFAMSLLAALAMYSQIYIFSGQAGIIPVSDYVIASVVTSVTIVMIVFALKMKQRGVLA